MDQELQRILERTRALVEQSRQVKSDKQNIYSEASQAAISAREKLQAHRELLRGIMPRV